MSTEPAGKKARTGIDRRSVTDDVDFAGKRVLMRVDFNVPQDKSTGKTPFVHNNWLH